MTGDRLAVFDLDGTLVDSDAALAAPFRALGVDPATVPWGLPLPDACARVGLTVQQYLAEYDPDAARPYDGVEDVLARLDVWAVCSNKHPTSGHHELDRLGWRPAAVWFNDGTTPKRLAPVLADLGVPPERVLFVGDTGHDRAAAVDAGCDFAVAGWNPRATVTAGDRVLGRPADVLDALAA
ncbi:MAG: HAD family hydrolase [Actinomycetota bacterium]